MVTVEQPKDKREKIESLKKKMTDYDKQSQKLPNNGIVFLVDIAEGKRELDAIEQQAYLDETVVQDVVVTPFVVSASGSLTKVKNLRTGEISKINETGLTGKARISADFNVIDGYDDYDIWELRVEVVDITTPSQKPVTIQISEKEQPDFYREMSTDICKRTYTAKGLKNFAAEHSTSKQQLQSLADIEKDMTPEEAVNFANNAETIIAEYYGSKQAERDLKMLRDSQSEKLKNNINSPIF